MERPHVGTRSIGVLLKKEKIGRGGEEGANNFLELWKSHFSSLQV